MCGKVSSLCIGLLCEHCHYTGFFFLFQRYHPSSLGVGGSPILNIATILSSISSGKRTWWDVDWWTVVAGSGKS